MKKIITSSCRAIFKNPHTKVWLLSLLLSFGYSNSSFTQCSLFCNPSVQISLDDNCFAEVTPDDILEGSWDASCEPFTVVVSATGGNFVTGAQIGQTVTVTVTAATGNSCSSSIIVSDYLAPTFSNCQAVSISCFDNPDNVNAPNATDNCDGNVSLSYTDQTQDNGCNGNVYQVITRTYTATDNSGNSSTCNQIINISRPSLAQVVFPPNYDDIQEPALDCDDADTATSNTGSPTIDGHPINTSCDFAAEFTDQITTICQNEFNILRNWIVYDWCNSTNITYTQTIKVLDKTAPTIICPPNQVISVNSGTCFASIIVPNANVSDNCSSANNIDIDVEVPEGYLNGNTLYNLPLGTHEIIYTATDDCGNASTCTMLIEVIDEVAPVAVCESFHTVGLNGPNGTLVEAIVFDDGSYDDCSDLIYEVRRMATTHCPGNDATVFDAYVPFYCCDIGNTVMIELRVTDASGNSNSCMVEATAEDQVNPAIICPPTVNIDCGDDASDLSLTGEATATDNCNVTITYNDFENTDNCGGGVINRTWTATDDSGNSASCLQQINLVNSTPFYITDTECNNPNIFDGVIWPCDYDTDACGPGLDPSVTGEPEIFEDFCDLVAVTYDDVELPITDNACVKILRTWLVVDWCQYDEDGGSDDGSWQYTQVIKVLNSADPVILTDCSNQSFCSYDENCEEGPATLILDANDDCTDSTDLNYYYWVDLNNDGSDDINESGNDASGNYPLGTHKITWHVEDGCGNVSECEYLFVISDCKAPTPNLLNGIATEMMENCEIEIWATDWDNPSSPSFDNCGIDEWRVVSPSQGPGQTAPPANAAANWTFSGADDLGTNTVDVWIQDINGNWAYVSTYILVQDNLEPFCETPEGAVISGTIETEIAEPVEHVTINLSGNAPGVPDMGDVTSTDEFGEYSVGYLPYGGNYVIAPEKDINPLNGVTTFDMVRMSQHILDIHLLDSPYKMIAADINNSGSLTTLDLVALRKVILFIDTAFTNNTSWRFVEADFVFPSESNPWTTSFPEVFTVNGLETELTADFVAIKTGDVNNSAYTHDELQEGSDTRGSSIPYIFETTNLAIQKTQTYSIPVYADDLNTMLGFQFSLDFDQEAIEIINIESGVLSSENLGLGFKEQGIITGSWHTASTLDIEERTILFTINVKAKKDSELVEVMKLNSTYTQAEAYNDELEILDLELAFAEEEKPIGTLYQNTPNPFSKNTKIAFNLVESGNTSLSIFDVSGKLVFKTESLMDAGYNEVEINKNDLSGAGIYFYQLEQAGGNNLVKKLVLTSRPQE